MQKTKYFSFKLGNLAKGCQLCVKGSKLVLFVTGLCPRSCYYCPISDKKYKKDVVYADEWPTDDVDNITKIRVALRTKLRSLPSSDFRDAEKVLYPASKDAGFSTFSSIIKEAEMIDAEGAGITGGDPLCKLDRVISYIQALKKRFGKKFHIHLYTSFDLVDEEKLKRLYDAGLDEIRFHADIDDEKLWNKIESVKKFDWDIGIEIPVIPGKLNETKKIIDFFNDKVQFINLNELEFADNQASKLGELGFQSKDLLSYGVKGSEEMAIELLKYISRKYPSLNVHYCTSRLKDRVQMANRIKRRAKNAAKDYDKITDEGLLFRGAIYSENLEKVSELIVNRYHIKKNLFEIDNLRGRILVSAEWLHKNRLKLKKHGLKIALVEEYPTYDCLNVVTDWL